MLNCLADCLSFPWEGCRGALGSLPAPISLPRSLGSGVLKGGVQDKGGGPFGERYKAKSQKLDPPAGVLLPSCYGQGQRQLGAQLARPGGRRCAAPGSGLQLWVSPAWPAPSLIRKLRREEGGGTLDFARERVKKVLPGRVKLGIPGGWKDQNFPFCRCSCATAAFVADVAADLWPVEFLRVFPRVLGICASQAD